MIISITVFEKEKNRIEIFHVDTKKFDLHISFYKKLFNILNNSISNFKKNISITKELFYIDEYPYKLLKEASMNLPIKIDYSIIIIVE